MTTNPPNTTRLQRARELADLIPAKPGDPASPNWGGMESDQLANELTSHNLSRVAVAVANLLLWAAEREEAAHPVAGTDDVPFCNVHPDTICPTHGGCPTPRPAHPAPISSPGDDNPQACDRGACTPHLTEMCGKHQDAYEANCVGRNLEQGLTTDGFAADAERERNPVIAVIDDYIAGLRIERDEALVKLAASEARCEQLTEELERTWEDGYGSGYSDSRFAKWGTHPNPHSTTETVLAKQGQARHDGLYAELKQARAKLTESEAAVARLREELGKREAVIWRARNVLIDWRGASIKTESGRALVELDMALSALDQPSQLEPVGEREIVVGSVWRYARTSTYLKISGFSSDGWVCPIGFAGSFRPDVFRREFEWVSDPPPVSDTATGET